jgi:hypothetical protein
MVLRIKFAKNAILGAFGGDCAKILKKKSCRCENP